MKSSLTKILQRFVAFLARHTVRKFSPLVIAITGSVGKTSSKEAVFSVLRDFKRVRRSSANFNNELGVPLTILGNWDRVWRPAPVFWLWVSVRSILRLIFGRKRAYPEVLVLEYGADAPGDIQELVSIAKPHIGIISSIGNIPVHVENYPLGIESVVKEKAKIINNLSSSDVAILNNDDMNTSRLTKKTRANVLTFGFTEGSRIHISQVQHKNVEGEIRGIACKISVGGSIIPLVIDEAFSVSHLYAAACGIAVGQALGINEVESVQALSKYYTPLPGRSIILEGIKHTRIIDESYNSSPIALEVALGTMKAITAQRKIGVLGDMLELGDFAVEAHQAIGSIVPDSLDVLITVGLRTKFIAEEAKKKGMDEEAVIVCETSSQAAEELKRILQEGDVVLIKGSRKVGLDEVVEEVRKM